MVLRTRTETHVKKNPVEGTTARKISQFAMEIAYPFTDPWTLSTGAAFAVWTLFTLAHSLYGAF